MNFQSCLVKSVLLIGDSQFMFVMTARASGKANSSTFILLIAIARIGLSSESLPITCETVNATKSHLTNLKRFGDDKQL